MPAGPLRHALDTTIFINGTFATCRSFHPMRLLERGGPLTSQLPYTVVKTGAKCPPFISGLTHRLLPST